MRILLIMDPAIPVPPPLYGGHERLVAMFAKEYEKFGYEVTLLAGPGSEWKRLKTYGINGYYRSRWQKTKELWQVWRYLLKSHQQFDLIHNFGRLLYLLPLLNQPVQKIMTYGREVSKKAIRRIHLFPQKNIQYTACSNYCVNTGNVAGKWHTIYNAIEFSKYNLQTTVTADAPLMFLGRVEALKGCHTAVKAALNTGNRLWIAGNIEPEHQDFFIKEVKPHLNEQIVYLGPLNDEQKNHYIGKSKALLFPIEWDEPFGMVMVEAMACGTPVIAFSKGSVPEVVEGGVTGYVVNDQQEMEEKIHQVHQLDRERCRAQAQLRFDAPIIAQHYLNLLKN